MKKAFIGVYGCQMNISDAERMEGQLKTIGYERVEEMEGADLILLNTCCVRETAVPVFSPPPEPVAACLDDHGSAHFLGRDRKAAAPESHHTAS